MDTGPELKVYPRSVVETGEATYFLARGPQGKVLGVSGPSTGFVGERKGDLLFAPLTAANAATLRARLPWLRPRPLGLRKSVGCGDRLGLATPGHVRAVRETDIAPVLAQQSMRENARTRRSPQRVLDDAMWGVLQEGWREPWGADADHLKSTDDVDVCVAAGYTFYTIDPGDHVDNEADYAPDGQLAVELLDLPWNALEDSAEAMSGRYLNRQIVLEGFVLEFDRTSLARAAAKYGRAIAHTAKMYRHLVRAMPSRDFDLEVSVDETMTPTSAREHYFVASELRRLGIRWVSLAPRYVGRFEKGVDYIGDLDEFDDELAKHAAIARTMGPYKLSIHSGSDKFRVYPSFASHAKDLLHLKTAGTSYLEALRAIAAADAGLFRAVLGWARRRYNEDKATYHVSADVTRVPRPEELDDGDLTAVLDTFDAREVLHVTFGSVLDRFRSQLHATLDANEDAYYDFLVSHFRRHLLPFVG